MICRSRDRRRRPATAAVEMAVVMIPLLVLVLCIVELGRLIQVAQVLVNAAREASRVASQGVVVQTLGNYNYVYANASNYAATPTPDGSAVNPLYLTDVVIDYLTCANVVSSTTSSQVTTTFAFITGDTSRTDPYQGTKNDRFTVTINVPYNCFRWTNVAWFGVQSLTETVTWQMVADDAYTVNDQIPSP